MENLYADPSQPSSLPPDADGFHLTAEQEWWFAIVSGVIISLAYVFFMFGINWVSDYYKQKGYESLIVCASLPPHIFSLPTIAHQQC
jgi:hypothetical protein